MKATLLQCLEHEMTLLTFGMALQSGVSVYILYIFS